jgi:hypothetical protein
MGVVIQIHKPYTIWFNISIEAITENFVVHCETRILSLKMRVLSQIDIYGKT